MKEIVIKTKKWVKKLGKMLNRELKTSIGKEKLREILKNWQELMKKVKK